MTLKAICETSCHKKCLFFILPVDISVYLYIKYIYLVYILVKLKGSLIAVSYDGKSFTIRSTLG